MTYLEAVLLEFFLNKSIKKWNGLLRFDEVNHGDSTVFALLLRGQKEEQTQV